MITLKDIVDEVLNEMNVYDEHDYLRLLKIAMRGFTDLSLYDMGTIRVAYLTMTDTNAVELPRDYIAYSKIGICIGGNIWTLGLRDNICLQRTERCGLKINELSSADTSSYATVSYINHTKNGDVVTGLYGLGGGFNVSYYREDKERGIIQFHGSVPQSEIVLEYVSNGISADGVTLIPEQAKEALIAWVNWKRKISDPQYSGNQIAMSKMEYLEEVEKLRAFEHSFTLDEMMDVFYESYKQTPKR